MNERHEGSGGGRMVWRRMIMVLLGEGRGVDYVRSVSSMWCGGADPHYVSFKACVRILVVV